MANIEVIHAYRHLYRGLLQAVQYSKPARFTVRNQLRTAFRERGANLDAKSISKTLRFLEAAARARGLEHRVLKNLLMVAHWRQASRPTTWRNAKHVASLAEKAKNKETPAAVTKHIEATAFKHYDMTVAMLNKSMGLCLR